MTSSRKSALLDPATLHRAVAEVAELAEDAEIDAVLAGGFALQQFGSPRLTGDIDVVASGAIPALREEEPLIFGGYQSTTPGGVPVDVILRADQWETLYEAALRAAEPHPDLPLRVVAPAFLVAMKMVAARLQDQQDLEWLIGSGTLDLDKTRKVIARHLGPYAVDEFERHLEFVEWESQKAKTRRTRNLARKLSR